MVQYHAYGNRAFQSIDISAGQNQNQFVITPLTDHTGSQTNILDSISALYVSESQLDKSVFNYSENHVVITTGARGVSTTRPVNITIPADAVYTLFTIRAGNSHGGDPESDPTWFFFSATRYQLLLRNSPIIDFLQALHHTDDTTPIVVNRVRLTNFWERNRRVAGNEPILINPGETRTGLAYGFTQLPTIINNQISCIMTVPPDALLVESDKVEWAVIKNNGKTDNPNTLFNVERRYNAEVRTAVPDANDKVYVIRRKTTYTDGAILTTKWYVFNSVLDHFIVYEGSFENKPEIIIDSDVGLGVYDEILGHTPEINVDRCV